MALTEVNSKGIKDADIATGDIADDAVTSAKIADDAITSALIADDAVVTAAIADDAITNALMADDAVGVAQLSASGTASSSTYLRGDNSWATVSTTDTKPFRNLLINGACQVNQRGTSTGISESGYYGPDHWNFIEEGSIGTWTISQDTEAPAGFHYSYKAECTSANSSLGAGDILSIGQRLEGQDLKHLLKGTSDAVSLTFSFWLKSSATGTYVVELYDSDNVRSIGQTISVGNTNWNKYTCTFAGDTSAGDPFTHDNNASLFAKVWLAAGSDYTSGTLNTSWNNKVDANIAVGQTNVSASTNTVYFTGWQLEVGSSATDFEYRSYADDLFRCQRYLYCIKGGTYDRWGYAYADSTERARAMMFLPTPLRASPTVTTNNFTVNENSGGTTACNYNDNLDAGLCEITYTHGSGVFSVANMYQAFFYGGGGYLYLTAEL